MKLRLLKPYEDDSMDVGYEFYPGEGMVYVSSSSIFNVSNSELPAKLLIEAGYIEEVVEKVMPKPKFKVGDCAVVVGSGRMLKVGHILPIDGDYKYEGYTEDKLRLPTKEELELYFR